MLESNCMDAIGFWELCVHASGQACVSSHPFWVFVHVSCGSLLVLGVQVVYGSQRAALILSSAGIETPDLEEGVSSQRSGLETCPISHLDPKTREKMTMHTSQCMSQ